MDSADPAVNGKDIAADGIVLPPREPGPESFSVQREGEGAILMTDKNEVFYNKAQVVNRDLSIAVLRLFLAKRQEEFETGTAPKKRRFAPDHLVGIPGENGAKEPAGEGSKPAGSASASAEEDAGGQAPAQENKAVAQEDAAAASSASGDHPRRENPKEAPPARILEGLAASGLRAIRYAKELTGLGVVIANDKDPAAVEACRRNIIFNGITHLVTPVCADVRLLMLQNEFGFDAVDLDPYGTPSMFLDSAVQSVAEGGLLLCTATDMAVLCGNNAESCYGKYGSYPLRAKYCHEMALRILLASIESHANRYKRHIVPVLSMSVDFYIRVFVRVYTSAAAVKESPSKLSYVYQCAGCDAFTFQPVGRIITKGPNGPKKFMVGQGPPVGQKCEHCGWGLNMGGPIWSEPLHDPEFVKSLLKEFKRNQPRYPSFEKTFGLITAVDEELKDCPLFVSLHSMSATLKCSPPSQTLFFSALANAGYRVSQSHSNPLAVKTDAPMTVLWDIMRCWVRDHQSKPHLPKDSPGAAILAKQPSMKANWARVASALSKASQSGVPRFLPNPEENWGPKARAGRELKPQPPQDGRKRDHGEAAEEGGEDGEDGNKRQKS